MITIRGWHDISLRIVSLAGCRYKQHRGKKEEIIAAVAQSVVLPFVRHAEGVGALLQDVEPGMPGLGPNGDFFVTVHSVAEGSQAEFRGLRAGDAIVRIGDFTTERMDKAQIGGLLGEAFSQMEEVWTGSAFCATICASGFVALMGQGF